MYFKLQPIQKNELKSYQKLVVVFVYIYFSGTEPIPTAPSQTQTCSVERCPSSAASTTPVSFSLWEPVSTTPASLPSSPNMCLGAHSSPFYTNRRGKWNPCAVEGNRFIRFIIAVGNMSFVEASSSSTPVKLRHFAVLICIDPLRSVLEWTERSM